MSTTKKIEQPSTFELLQAVHNALEAHLKRKQTPQPESNVLSMPPEIAEYAARSRDARDGIGY